MSEQTPQSLFPRNVVPSEYALPEGFLEFFMPLQLKHGADRDVHLQRRKNVLGHAEGSPPDYLPRVLNDVVDEDWRITVPAWCQDQRNQMTLPADDAKMVVQAFNSGPPGEMMDLEDSIKNGWTNLNRGIANARKALLGELTFDKNGVTVGMNESSSTVLFTRVRGLHLEQHFAWHHQPVSGSLFDLAMLVYKLDFSKLKHPLCIYIPKSESAEEARWWRAVLRDVAVACKRQPNAIKCMALVESHPMAYQMEEFLYYLRDHILGLNLGRWDYMASLGHFKQHDPNWVLPDRNTIPHDVPFFQNLRRHMVRVCHTHGALAIGGMTALFPDRKNPEQNTRALAVLANDKKNEADCGMDGAWTGHPDQNEIAVAAFPAPNQAWVESTRSPEGVGQPDLRPPPYGVGKITIEGTRAAVRTTILYRAGVLADRGASLINGYMEDLATDRIYRVMLSQRIRHGIVVDDGYGGKFVHTMESVDELYSEESHRIAAELGPVTRENKAERLEQSERIYEAASISYDMIERGEFDPT